MSTNKAKAQKGPAQKHLHSRISYLYQAATYFAEASVKEQTRNPNPGASDPARNNRGTVSATSEAPVDADQELVPANSDEPTINQVDGAHGSKSPALVHRLLGHLRAVSLKGQIRLSPAIKHTICNRCDLLLVPGTSASTYMENKSRGRKKSRADVLVMTCTTCGTAKRFPIGAKRQLKRQERPAQATAELMEKPDGP